MFRSKQYAFELGGAFALYAALLIGAAAAEPPEGVGAEIRDATGQVLIGDALCVARVGL